MEVVEPEEHDEEVVEPEEHDEGVVGQDLEEHDEVEVEVLLDAEVEHDEEVVEQDLEEHDEVEVEVLLDAVVEHDEEVVEQDLEEHDEGEVEVLLDSEVEHDEEVVEQEEVVVEHGHGEHAEVHIHQAQGAVLAEGMGAYCGAQLPTASVAVNARVPRMAQFPVHPPYPRVMATMKGAQRVAQPKIYPHPNPQGPRQPAYTGTYRGEHAATFAEAAGARRQEGKPNGSAVGSAGATPVVLN